MTRKERQNWWAEHVYEQRGIAREYREEREDGMTIVIFCGQNAQWFLRLVASNGETVLVSEGYTRRSSARRAAKRLAAQFRIQDIFELGAGEA